MTKRFHLTKHLRNPYTGLLTVLGKVHYENIFQELYNLKTKENVILGNRKWHCSAFVISEKFNTSL